MNKENIIITTSEELKKAFIEWSNEIDLKKASIPSDKKTLSINQTAKRLGRAHATIKKMICEGSLNTTADQRRVTEQSLNAYISGKINNN